MIPDRVVAVLMAAFAAGADMEKAGAIAVVLGVPVERFYVWHMGARRSIEAAMRDWEILQDGVRWREQLAQAALSEMG